VDPISGTFHSKGLHSSSRARKMRPILPTRTRQTNEKKTLLLSVPPQTRRIKLEVSDAQEIVEKSMINFTTEEKQTGLRLLRGQQKSRKEGGGEGKKDRKFYRGDGPWDKKEWL